MFQKLKEWHVIIFLVILVLAILLRFLFLDLKPVHHDESIHAFLAWELYTEGKYVYNPTYHGPLIYFSTAFVYLLSDGVADDATIRVLPAALGVVLVLLLLPLRRYLGKYGLLSAAFMLSFSPSFLYFSRYLRNDIYMAVITMIFFVVLFQFKEKGKSRYLIILTLVILAGAYSKENIYLIVFIFLSYFIVERFYLIFRRRYPLKVEIGDLKAIFMEYWDVVLLCAALAVFGYVFVFSNLFRNPDFLDSTFLASFKYWGAQHEKARLGGPFYFYIPLLLLYEPLILLLGIMGGFYFFIRWSRADRGFTHFLIYWSVASFLIYSYYQEKVPWLILNIVLPLILLGSTYLDDLVKKFKRRRGLLKKPLFMGILIFLAFMLVFSSTQLNFRNQANPAEPYTQVQTSNDMFFLLDTIDRLSETNGGSNMTIFITSKDYWPLPWYFKDRNNIKYFREISKADIHKLDPPVIVADILQETEMKEFESIYHKRRIKLRAWFLPQFEEVTAKELILYYFIRKEFSPIGSSDLLMYWK